MKKIFWASISHKKVRILITSDKSHKKKDFDIFHIDKRINSPRTYNKSTFAHYITS